MITRENLGKYYTRTRGHRTLKRKFNLDMPEFDSHAEAKDWFKQLFGDAFKWTESLIISGQLCWHYVLVHDQEAWEEGQAVLRTTGIARGLDFVMASQDIQIFDDGETFIGCSL